jgi:anti-sigma B factor antagonist
MSPFKIEVREAAKGVVVVGLAGRLNAASAPDVKERLKGLGRAEPHNLVLDLKELSFIDSSGLAALVAGFKAATEAGGTLKLAHIGPQVAEVLSLTRLDRVFEIFPGTETAVRSFSAKEE